MRILITGANGLLGQKLVALLTEDTAHQIIATGRGANRNPAGGYAYFGCDLTDPEQVHNLFYEASPDYVVHAAAMTQVDECELNQTACWQANVAATAHIISACEAHQAALQYISTDFVFDGASGPYREEDAPNPLSHYGWSKLEAEKRVQETSVPASIVRTVLVYGVAHDMSRSNIVLWVKKSLEAGKAINVVNDQWRTPTLVEDLAMGCKQLLDSGKKGVFHLSGDEMMSPYELAVKTANYFGLDYALITAVDQSVFTQPGKRPPKTGFVIDKAKEELGFQPRSFEAGLTLLKSQL